jgi:soluble lytic murein transglycosylase
MNLTAGLLLLILLLTDFRAATVSVAPNLTENFRQGHIHFLAKRYAQAKESFEKAVDVNYPLADYSLYYLALIAFHESDWESSRRLLSRLRNEYPRSVWFHAAELQRAKIDIAEMKYSRAADTLRLLRAETNLRSDIAEEVLWLQAKAHNAQGDFQQAFSLYQELRSLFPHSSWTAAARKEVGRLRERYPDLFGLSTVTSIGEEADRLAKERQHGEADVLYKKLLDQELGPSLRLHFLNRLADLYLSIRKRNEALPLLEEIARNYPDHSHAPQALYRIGTILWNRHDNAQALEVFKRLIDRYPASPQLDRAYFAAADIYESQGKKEEAIAYYGATSKRFPHSQERDNATWRLAWLYYRAGDPRKALSTFKTLASHTREEITQAAALYWQGRCAERLGDSEAAKQLYRRIYRLGEESYYQALAVERLVHLNAPVADIQPVSRAVATEPEPAVNADVAFHLVRARELVAINLNTLAVGELNEANRLTTSQPSLRSLLMREYARAEAYNQSVAIANQLPRTFEERNRYRFPLAHWDTIQDRSRELGLDPYLVVALIRQESLFDPRARSPAAALGLMQLLPTTAARVAKQLGLPAPANEKLFDPQFNMALGTYYLKDLLRRYSNNWQKAIAAYNAGEQAVDRWEKEISTDDIEEFVERIPYSETRQYVKLVMRNHRVYKRLYEHQK